MTTAKKLDVRKFNCGAETRNVAALTSICGSLPMVEACRAVKEFNSAHGVSASIIGPATVDALVHNGHWQFFVGHNYFMTDAFVAYEAPGKALGTAVTFQLNGQRLVVPTGSAKGMKGVALLAAGLSADCFSVEGNDIIADIPAAKLVVLERFPAKNGWYHADNQHSIPEGDELKSLSEGDSAPIRYLWRSDGSFVGPLVRDIRVEGDCPGIIANLDGFHRFSVMVEMGDAGAAKLAAK